jgi:hypothetical protein
MVYRSRFTPGLRNGADVSFDKGEVVTYRTRSGSTVKITIDSGLKSHALAPGDHTGYECIFHDNWEKAFASREGIIGWEGKAP